MSHTAFKLMFIILILAGSGLAGADPEDNLLLNPGAEQGKDDLPSIWFPAQVPAEGLKMWRSGDTAHSGKFSLAISNEHRYKEQVANNWGQKVVDIPAGKVICLSGWLKTQNADAVNICVQCWDVSGQTMLAFASTPVFGEIRSGFLPAVNRLSFRPTRPS